MSYAENIKVNNITNDAFGLAETASPQTIFDAQFTYDLQPLLYEAITTGSGTVAYDSTNGCADIAINAASGANSAFLQTYEYFRYQPGKGQKVFITFNYVENPPDGYTKTTRYGDASNGMVLELNSSGELRVKILTTTDEGNQEQLVDHSSLGVALNKETIFVVQFEALYVGSVEYFIQVNSELVKLHEFDNANNTDAPYIRTANLPVKVGIEGTGAINTSMIFNCCSVQSSGGQDVTVGYSFSTTAEVTAANGARTHILSVRPKTTFNSLENRSKFVLESVDFLVTGNNPVNFELAIGQAITGASYTDVNATYSAFERSEGTIDGVATMYFDGSLVGATNQIKGTASVKTPLRVPITLDAAGAVRADGTLSIVATGLGGTSACRVKMNWKEIR